MRCSGDARSEWPSGSAVTQCECDLAIAHLKIRSPHQRRFGASRAVQIYKTHALGDILVEMGQPQQARASYERALELARTIEPEFQVRSIASIEAKIESTSQNRR